MAIVQTAYPNFHDPLAEGQLVNPQTCDVDSLLLPAGAVPIPFGRAVQGVGSGPDEDRDINLGIAYGVVGELNGQVAANGAALTLAAAVASGVLAQGSFLVLGSEIVRVGAASNGNRTYAIERAQFGTAAAVHANGSAVRAFDRSTFRGIAIMDERLPGTSAGEYTAGEIVSALYRGNVAVRVSAAVREGDHVVAATVASGAGAAAEAVGQFSAKPPDATHVRIPGARFTRTVAAQEIATVRLTGPLPVS